MIPRKITNILNSLELELEKLDTTYGIKESKNCVFLSITWYKFSPNLPRKRKRCLSELKVDDVHTSDVQSSECDTTDTDTLCKSDHKKHKSPSQLRHQRQRRRKWTQQKKLLRKLGHEQKSKCEAVDQLSSSCVAQPEVPSTSVSVNEGQLVPILKSTERNKYCESHHDVESAHLKFRSVCNQNIPVQPPVTQVKSLSNGTSPVDQTVNTRTSSEPPIHKLSVVPKQDIKNLTVTPSSASDQVVAMPSTVHSNMVKEVNSINVGDILDSNSCPEYPGVTPDTVVRISSKDMYAFLTGKRPDLPGKMYK